MSASANPFDRLDPVAAASDQQAPPLPYEAATVQAALALTDAKAHIEMTLFWLSHAPRSPETMKSFDSFVAKANDAWRAIDHYRSLLSCHGSA